MPETIVTKFDPASLPAWARRHPGVVALCERDLAYRCDVCSAKTAQVRKVCLATARQSASTANPTEPERLTCPATGTWCYKYAQAERIAACAKEAYTFDDPTKCPYAGQE